MNVQQRQVDQIRVVTVTKDGLLPASSSLFDRLQQTTPESFVAIDTEFSGLGDDPASKDDNLEKRYAALRRIAHTRAIFSVGISIFNPTSSSSSSYSSSSSSSSNLYQVATYDFLLSCQSPYEISPSSGSFLEAHGFDFNRMFRVGIPYERASHYELLQQQEEQNISTNKESETQSHVPSSLPKQMSNSPFVYGALPRGLLWRIGRHGIPIIVHNGLLDLVFLYAAVQGALPETLNEFVGALLDCVPAGFWDSKVLAPLTVFPSSSSANKQQNNRASFLGYLFAKSVLDGHVNVENSPGLPRPSIADPPEMNMRNNKSRRDDRLCALYAFRGFCPRATNCPFAHDSFRVVQEEREGKAAKDSKEAHRRHKEQSKSYKRLMSDMKAETTKLSKKQRMKLELDSNMNGKNNSSTVTPTAVELSFTNSNNATTTTTVLNSNCRNDVNMKENGDQTSPSSLSPSKSNSDEPVDEHSKKLHTAGWDAFCTAYIFAALRSTTSTQVLEKHHNYIALPCKLSNLLLRKSEYAKLDG